MMPLLEASDLSLAHRLHATALKVDRPQLVCLVGPNGSGKTSLLHALAGIGNPRGAVRIGGTDARKAPPPERRRLFSYLPATRDIAWPLTVRDAVGLALGADNADISRALETLELTNFAERRVDRLSTGERSRVLLARALAARPRLLLLDEPIANLDPLWQLRLMEILRRHADVDGQAVIMALHDLDLAASHADRLLIMQNGRIAADGDPHALVAGPTIPAVFGIEQRDGRWQPCRPG